MNQWIVGSGNACRQTGAKPLPKPLTIHSLALFKTWETCDPFYYHGLTLIPAWISNHLPSKVWGEITYPLLNFNGATVEV